MICEKCGSEVKDTAKYCPSCGASMATINSPAPRIEESLSDAVSTADFADAVESDFQVGDVINDRYEVLAELGRGGMGSVYKVKDRDLDVTIALKSMHSKYVSNEKAIQRFKQELILSRDLKHKNIVTTYDIGEWNSIRFFTMEFIEGCTLQDLIAKNKKTNKTFSLEDTALIIGQICSGLEYAHERTVHRDIKPANIMISDPDNLKSSLIKINDFGIAKVTTSSQLTIDDATMGSAYYMAPEQRASAANVDRRADIYSVGVVLYEMLTGDLPQGRFSLPSEIRAELPKDIDRIVEKSLQTDPSRRYESAGELADELASVCYGNALPASSSNKEHLKDTVVIEQKSAPVRESSQSTPQKSKSSFIAVAAIALILIISAIFFFSSKEPPPPVELTGGLSVNSNIPGADVYINNEFKGKVPVKLKIKPGSYSIKVSNSGYQDYEDKFKINASQEVPVFATLFKSHGSLSVTSNVSGADIYINNEFKGKAPIELSLAPGAYTVSVSKSGYKNYEKKINVYAEDVSYVEGSLIKINYPKTAPIPEPPARPSITPYQAEQQINKYLKQARLVNVKATVDNQYVVILKGYVNKKSDIDYAERIAKSLRGVSKTKNFISYRKVQSQKRAITKGNGKTKKNPFSTLFRGLLKKGKK